MKWFLIIIFVVFMMGVAMALIIPGDSSYSSLDYNVTQEVGFAHLNISNNAPYNSLLLYLPFDVNQTINGTQYDYSKYNNEANVTGGTLWNQSGLIGSAYTFDGFDDYIDVGNDAFFNLSSASSEITISAWIRTNVTNVSIFSMRRSSTQNPVFDLQVGYDGVDNGATSGQGFPSIIVRGDNNAGLTHIHTSKSVTDNNWYHILATRNSSKSLKIYINGVLNVSGLDTMTSGLTFDQIRIGDEFFNANIRNFNGSIDEVMVFNVSLSSSQVLDIYNNQSSRFQPSGKMIFQNINLSSGTNAEINLTAYQNLLGSIIYGQLSNGVQNGSIVEFTKLSSMGTISSYDLSGITNRTNMNLTLFFYPNGTINYGSIVNDTTLSWVLSATPDYHFIDTSSKNILRANLTTTFSISVGSLNVYLNGNNIGNISTLDSSPKIFQNIESYLIRGKNNITYSPPLASTASLVVSNISFIGYADFYSPLVIGNITINDYTIIPPPPPLGVLELCAEDFVGYYNRNLPHVRPEVCR